jgi:hypothetical protein
MSLYLARGRVETSYPSLNPTRIEMGFKMPPLLLKTFGMKYRNACAYIQKRFWAEGVGPW